MNRRKINISGSAIKFDPIAVSDIDLNHMLYGNYIGVQYVFQNNLGVDNLAKATRKLCEQFPALSGCLEFKTRSIIPNTCPVQFRHQTNWPGSASDYMTAGTIQARRRDFVLEPDRRTFIRGAAPVMTLCLTDFEGGGSILGIAINHVLTDAAGFHKTANHLAQIYSAFCQGAPPPDWPYSSKIPVFDFGTNRSRHDWQAQLSEFSWAKPAKIGGLSGAPMRNIVLWSMGKIASQNRLAVVLNRDQVADLKDAVLKQSGEEWISTNVAICAHFASIMARLIGRKRPSKPFRVGQLLDLRGRYFDENKDLQRDFIGNAILIHTQHTGFEPGIPNYDRKAFAKFFKKSVAELDGQSLRRRLDLIADGLRHGYTYPGLEMSDPLLAVNNQSKMPVYDIDFNGQSPDRVIPQDVGDNIMFFSAPKGGIEIYLRDILNPKRQALLQQDEWRQRIFSF